MWLLKSHDNNNNNNNNHTLVLLFLRLFGVSAYSLLSASFYVICDTAFSFNSAYVCDPQRQCEVKLPDYEGRMAFKLPIWIDLPSKTKYKNITVMMKKITEDKKLFFKRGDAHELRRLLLLLAL